MNSAPKLIWVRPSLIRSLEPALIAKRLLLGLLLVWPAGFCVHAQINASATFSSQPAGLNFDYTLTLNNASGSTSPIETLWYAWLPGEDFLPTSPITVQPPSGWTDIITGGGAGDGYTIQFVTSTAPLNPGNSLTFIFESADTPAELAGNSPFHSTTPTPVGTSVVYAGGPFVGATETFVVQP